MQKTRRGLRLFLLGGEALGRGPGKGWYTEEHGRTRLAGEGMTTEE